MFEMIWNISNVVFLISNVVLGFCGSFFEVWGISFPKSGKTAIVSDGEDKSVGRVNEDFYMCESFSVMREG